MPILLIIALAALALFIVYGIILSYHWFRYSISGGVATLSVIIFASGGIFFLFFLFGAAIALS